MGGDLAGPPSNASVMKVRGQSYNPSGAVSGSAMLFDGSGWNAQGLPSSGSTGTEDPYLISTLAVTSSIAWPTTSTTFASVLIPTANVTPGWKVRFTLGFTTNVTSGVPQISFRGYINNGLGYLFANPTFASASTRFCSVWFELRFVRGANGNMYAIYNGSSSLHIGIWPILPAYPTTATLTSPYHFIPPGMAIPVAIYWQGTSGSPVLFVQTVYQEFSVFR